MKNLLLGIIAINLTFISVNLTLRSIEPVQAQMSRIELRAGIDDCFDRATIKPVRELNGISYVFQTRC